MQTFSAVPRSSTESAAWVNRDEHLEVVGLDVDRFDQSGHAGHVLVLLLPVHPKEYAQENKMRIE